MMTEIFACRRFRKQLAAFDFLFFFFLSSLFLLYSSCFLSSFLFLLLSCRFAFAKQQHAVFKYRFLTALCAALSSSFFFPAINDANITFISFNSMPFTTSSLFENIQMHS